MASRPRAGRGMNGRDSGKDVDQIAEVHAQILEGVRMAKTYREKCSQLGSQIVALEDEITAKGGSRCTLLSLNPFRIQLLQSDNRRVFSIDSALTDRSMFLL